MSLRHLIVFVPSLLVLSLGACADSDHQRDVAIAHARANPELQRAADQLAGLGWRVSDGAAASVDWLDAATRIRIPVARGGQAGEPGVAADLVVVWPEDGADEFAIQPRDDAGGAEIARALETVDGPDPLSLAAPPVTAAACGVENAACGGVTTCCRGLVCAEPRDNHFICFCSQPVTVRYNAGPTASLGCVSPENPIGAARKVRTIRGCGPGGSLLADACGRPVSGPAYTRSSSTVVVCYFAPPSGCTSE